MKETTIILTPVVIIILVLIVLFQKGKSRPFLLFSIRHTATHLAYSVVLLTVVLLFRSGRYVSVNYAIKSDIGQLFDFSMDALSKGFPVFYILIIGGIFAVILMWKYRFIQNETSGSHGKMVWILVLTIGLFLGFWLINIPWRQKLIKYYLPAFFFASFGAVTIQGFIFQTLWGKRLKLAAALWILGSCYFLLNGFNSSRVNIIKLYNEHYEYRKIVPLISRDIDISSSGRTDVCKIHIAAGQLFQEGKLPFLRHVNLLYKKNIWNNGHIVQYIKACEKNYFRIYPDESSVSITYRENLPDNFEPDILYVINDAINQNQLNIKYRLANGWVIEKPAIIIKKYIRQDRQITGIQS